MGRIRSVKPEVFRHEELFELEQDTKLPIRLAWIGLWTCCDREGRFKWRPRSLKTEILPYDDVDFSRVLDALASRGFIVRYTSLTDSLGYIPTWKDHQYINGKEPKSILPSPPEQSQLNEIHNALITRTARVPHASSTDGVKEGKGKEVNNASGTRDSDQKIFLIAKLHPKLAQLDDAELPQKTMTAIIQAVESETERSDRPPISEADALRLVWKETDATVKAMAAAGKIGFIKGPDEFWQLRLYRPECRAAQTGNNGDTPQPERKWVPVEVSK